MFPVTPHIHAYSSEHVELKKVSAETGTTRDYEAVFHSTAQDRTPAVAQLRLRDNAMRLHIMNTHGDIAFRPATPKLQNIATWLSVRRDALHLRNYLNRWQANRGARLVGEDELSSIVTAEQAHQRFAESELDGDVACVIRASCTGSQGAGSSIVACLRGTGSDGEPILASIHKSVSAEAPYIPAMAYKEIILPLEQKVMETLARSGGHLLVDKRFYFAGGNSQTLESCAALAFAAQRMELNVPVSMLGINDDKSYVNVMLGRPVPVEPNGVFFVARVHEAPDVA